MDNFIGPNLIITCIIPYLVVTGLQDTYLQIGLIIASVWAGVHLIIHSLLFVFNKSKVFPYILEVAQLILYPILLGICATNENAKNAIQLYFNFIVLSTLAGTSLLSLIVAYPLGLQHVQELVPWVYSRHEDVLKLGYHTTSLFCAATTALCLLYLIPVTRGEAENHYHVFNLIFRLILPTVVVALVIIIMRVWPDIALGCLQGTAPGAESLWKYPVVIAPNGGTRVIDNAMFAHPTKVAINPYAIPEKPLAGYLPASHPPAGGYPAPPAAAPYALPAKSAVYAPSAPSYPDKASPMMYATPAQPAAGYNTPYSAGLPNNSSYPSPAALPPASYAPVPPQHSLLARPATGNHVPEVLQVARPPAYAQPQPTPAGFYKVQEPAADPYAQAGAHKAATGYTAAPAAYAPPPPAAYAAAPPGAGYSAPPPPARYGPDGGGGSYQPGYPGTGGAGYPPTGPSAPVPGAGSYQPAPYHQSSPGGSYPAPPPGQRPQGYGSGPAGYVLPPGPAPPASAGGNAAPSSGSPAAGDFKIPAYYSTPGGRP